MSLFKKNKKETDPAYYPENHSAFENILFLARIKVKRFYKTVIMRYFACSWLKCDYDDTECGHLLGGKIHDQWCNRCDKFRGIPCLEHPKYDKK